MSSSRKQRLRWKELEGDEENEMDDSSIWLPDEIMYLIIVKLMMMFPTYLARFSAVCKRWHRLVCDAWPKLVHQHQITSLVLVVPDDCKEKGGEKDVKQLSYRMYNLMGECLPAPVNSLPYGSTRIIGSSFGWLILTDMNNSVSLFNPLSKSHIRLPPLHRLSYLYPLLVKGVLSKPPQGGGHLDIAITMGPGTRITTSIRIAVLRVENIMGELESLEWGFHDSFGDEILDVNTICGRICRLHGIGYISCFSYRCIKYGGVRKAWPLTAFDGDLANVYFLESSSSSGPLVILRYKLLHNSPPRTVGFKILAFTSNDEEFNKTTWSRWTDWRSRISLMNWTEVKSLGNDVLFLGDDNVNSICIQAAGSEHAGSIYFTDQQEYYPPNFGVFNVDQNRLTTHCSHRSSDGSILDTKLLQTLSTIWLLPSYDEILKFSSIG